LNEEILSYALTKLAVILMGANELSLRLTSVSFCGKRKTRVTTIGVLLSFNYVSIKAVMSSKSRYMVGSKSRWAMKPSQTYSLLQEYLLHVFHHRQGHSLPHYVEFVL
jgi:hypothetical protein